MVTEVETSLSHNRIKNSEYCISSRWFVSALSLWYRLLYWLVSGVNVFQKACKLQPVKIILLISLWYTHDWNILIYYLILSRVLMILEKSYLMMMIACYNVWPGEDNNNSVSNWRSRELIAWEQQHAICFGINLGYFIIFTSVLQFLSWDSGWTALS